MIPSLTHDSLGRRYRRMFDRKRCERQDNPLPRPSDDELLEMFTRLTAAQIASDLGRNENTVRSWINRAMYRDLSNPKSRAAFNAWRLKNEVLRG